LDKLKLKTQLLKPLSRPYLLHWVAVVVGAVEVLEVVVPALEAAAEVLLEVEEEVAVVAEH
jgi:hypothetical protein